MKDTRVVYYKKNNGIVGATVTIFKGTYDECLKFYIENKSKYRIEGKHLELMML